MCLRKHEQERAGLGRRVAGQRRSLVFRASRFGPGSGYGEIGVNVAVRENLPCNEVCGSGCLFVCLFNGLAWRAKQLVG